MERSRQNSSFHSVYHHLSQNTVEEDQCFLKLQKALFAYNAQLKQDRFEKKMMFFSESGRVGENRRYFYLKPMGMHGWLFERSGHGWVVSRSEKIVLQDTFIRKGEPWDNVALYRLGDSDQLRVKSQMLGDNIVSFSFYETKMRGYIFAFQQHQESEPRTQDVLSIGS